MAAVLDDPRPLALADGPGFHRRVAAGVPSATSPESQPRPVPWMGGPELCGAPHTKRLAAAVPSLRHRGCRFARCLKWSIASTCLTSCDQPTALQRDGDLTGCTSLSWRDTRLAAPPIACCFAMIPKFGETLAAVGSGPHRGSDAQQ